MTFDKLRSPNTFVVKPDWRSFTTSSGLLLGEEVHDRSEDMPVHLYPTSGIVVSSPMGSSVKPGSVLYFTWNAVSFNKCISPIDEENLFALNLAWYAYREDGVLKTTDDFFLLKPVAGENRTTETGLLINGYSVIGSIENAEVVEGDYDAPLVGEVVVCPDKDFGVLIGDRVCVAQESDVVVTIDNEKHYRVRASELLFKYE